MKPIETGKLNIDFPAALGPMAGVTDLPFRLLCSEMGAGLLYTEMVSAKALHYKSRNTAALLKKNPGEGPIGVQLFGSDPDVIAETGLMLENDFDFIDINMGCPMEKVVKNGEGSILMTKPELVEKILTKLVKTVHIPVSVKMRKGFAIGEENAPEIAKIAESCGVSFVAVHGRTREEYFTGKADLDCIRRVKEAVRIPVIGNGDIYSARDAHRMLLKTGCDGIMVAQGAMGNPWIFKEIRAELSEKPDDAAQSAACGGNATETAACGSADAYSGIYEADCVRGYYPDRQELKEMILRHARLLIAEKGPHIGVLEMRKHASWYLKGVKNGVKMRQRINEIGSIEELEEILEMLI